MPFNPQEVFSKAYECTGEEQLHSLIQSEPAFSDSCNWVPYGGNENNFAAFENQSANPIPALVEKITNSIDALLLKECKKRHIDPQSSKAPQGMAEAVELFFGIENGDFSEVFREDRRKIAEHIQIIASGDLNTPDVVIYDDGEGQAPDDFPETFLSLFRGNKKKIPFVQGKYNMGSTGAVIFCGAHRYQLIASKSAFANPDKQEFGFTIVRRHPLSEDEGERFKSSWYEYFTIDGKIPRFISSKMDLGLYKKIFESGSIIKLYSYALPRGCRSSVVWDLWRELNQYLYQPALPVLLYEKRFPQQKTPSKPMLGNKTRLTVDEREKKEKVLTFSIDDRSVGKVQIEAIVLKPEVETAEFIRKKSVIFTVNGQVHAAESSSFISQELMFPLLKNSLLVQVDCTHIRTDFRQDLFKGSRDRFNEGLKTEQLKDKLIELLKSNETLREIHQQRKNALIQEDKDDANMLKEVVGKIPLNKDLLAMLKQSGEFNFLKDFTTGNGERKREAADKQKTEKPYVSARFPSIFQIKLKESLDGRKVKTIPLNGKGVIEFETDVEDEYLFRPKEKGELLVQILKYSQNSSQNGKRAIPSVVDQVFEVTKTGPCDNSIRITFAPKENVCVGDEVEISTTLTAPGNDLESIFWIKIVDPQKKVEDKKKDVPADEPSLPIPIKVYEKTNGEPVKTWDDYRWSGHDIVKIIEVTDPKTKKTIVEAIAINMDSFALKRHLAKTRNASAMAIKMIKDKYFLQVYFHSLFLHVINTNIENQEDDDPEMEVADRMELIFQKYAPFLLALDANDYVMKAISED